MLVQPQQTKDDDNELRTNPANMNNPPTSAEPASNQATPIIFNVLVVGQAGIGKTGLIKLLLDTSNLSSATSLPQLARLAEFANFAATCPTNSPSPILAELPATPHRPEIVLKLIDTPGLLYHDSHELEAGLQLVLRQIADSFEASNHASALAQERRDKQIHLCLYLLDPADIVPASTRHLRRPERYGVSPQLTRQRVQLSAMRTAMARTTGEGSGSMGGSRDLEDMPHYDDSPEDEWGRATVPTSELNIIKRLSEYVTVMPIVAKADTLTIERLDTVKGAIRRDLIEAGITFAPFESQSTGTSVLPSTPPPDAHAPLLPYAIMMPDRYHHGDGVLRSGTSARPTHKQYMSRYQETPSVEKDASWSVVSPFVQRQDLVRTYRWGVVNILDPTCSDFLALRDAILGPSVQTLRAYTDEVLFENYRRSLSVDSRYARDPQESRQPPYPPIAPPEPVGRSLRPNPPSLPSHSLEAYKTNTRSPYPHTVNPASSQYSLAPLENPPPSGNMSLRSNPPILTPLSTMLHTPLKYGHHNPTLSPDDDAPRSPGPSPIQPPKHRTGRKVAVACNFCRSRKLKCDGGRPQCLQCIRRTVDCEYEPTAKRRGLARPSDAAPLGSGDYSQSHPRGASPRVPGGEVDQGASIPPKSVACQFCRARKTRCDGLQPQCSNCKKRNQDCVYTYGGSYVEEEGSSNTARRFPSSSAGATSLPSIQSLPLGTALSDSVPPPTGYWHSTTTSPQLHSALPPRRSVFSPLSRARSIPGPAGPSSSSLGRHQVESEGLRGFGSFPLPPPAYPTPYTSETRRPSTSGADSQNWRDRSSFSSTSTRGGMSATPSTPNLKRKASHPDEEEGEGEIIRLGETSPSPPKRRRVSGAEETLFSTSSHRSQPSHEEHEEGEGEGEIHKTGT